VRQQVRDVLTNFAGRCRLRLLILVLILHGFSGLIVFVARCGRGTGAMISFETGELKAFNALAIQGHEGGVAESVESFHKSGDELSR
jgi:hypothetical protein